MDDPMSTTNKDADDITPVSGMKQFKFANAITPTGAGGIEFGGGGAGADGDNRFFDEKGRPV